MVIRRENWVFSSFLILYFLLYVFDNVSCNIITVINPLLIVLIASDLYNILFGTSLHTTGWLIMIVPSLKDLRIPFWPRDTRTASLVQVEKPLVGKKRRPDQIAWTNILVCGSLCWPVFLEKLRIAFYMWTDVIRMVFRLIWIQKCEFRQNTKSVIGIWSGEIWSDLHLVTSLILTNDKKIPDEKSFLSELKHKSSV